MKALLFLLLTTPAMAQSDTVARWGWTNPPPPMNIVNAGFELDKDANSSSLAAWSAIVGAVMGTAFYLDGDRDVAYGVWGMGFVAHFAFTLNAAKHRHRAAQHWQQGWSKDRLYESEPDSVGSAPPKRIER